MHNFYIHYIDNQRVMREECRGISNYKFRKLMKTLGQGDRRTLATGIPSSEAG